MFTKFQSQKGNTETHYHISQSERRPTDFVTSIEEQVIRAESGATLASAPPGHSQRYDSKKNVYYMVKGCICCTSGKVILLVA